MGMELSDAELSALKKELEQIEKGEIPVFSMRWWWISGDPPQHTVAQERCVAATVP